MFSFIFCCHFLLRILLEYHILSAPLLYTHTTPNSLYPMLLCVILKIAINILSMLVLSIFVAVLSTWLFSIFNSYLCLMQLSAKNWINLHISMQITGTSQNIMVIMVCHPRTIQTEYNTVGRIWNHTDCGKPEHNQI